MILLLLTARRWVSVGLLSATLFGAAPLAQAAIYTGNWDPLFNADFSSDLGWRGSISVTVDDACLLPSSVQVVGSECSAVLNSGVLKFYDVDTNVDFETRPFSGPFFHRSRSSVSTRAGIWTRSTFGYRSPGSPHCRKVNPG